MKIKTTTMSNKSIQDLNEEELGTIAIKIKEYYDNAKNNVHPAIFSVKNRLGKSECQHFIGAFGGSSRKENTRPQVKFNVLPKKILLATAMDAVYKARWNEAHPDEAYNYEYEISHLCSQKWCINPNHIVRENHITNCQRRDNCSRHRCVCESQGRKPHCV